MDDRNSLIAELQPFARRVAGRILKRRNGAARYLEDDFMSAAALGTVKSVDKYLAGAVDRKSLHAYTAMTVAHEIENVCRSEATFQTRYQEKVPPRSRVRSLDALKARRASPRTPIEDRIAEAVPDAINRRIVAAMLDHQPQSAIAASLGMGYKAFRTRRNAIGEALLAAGIITGDAVGRSRVAG